MEKNIIFELIKDVLTKDDRLVFAYAHGSLVKEELYRDIDIGVYVKNQEENPFSVLPI